jgi:hypothetical protein
VFSFKYPSLFIKLRSATTLSVSLRLVRQMTSDPNSTDEKSEDDMELSESDSDLGLPGFVQDWEETESEVLKTYDQLDEGHIRLLRVLPSNRGKQVSCCLITARLASEPKYEAISYAWGKSANMVNMTLNGKPCWVKHNLLDCLESLRFETEIRDLWVDALCINQADTEEKSAQINLMPQIYRLAAKTLIWLGMDDYYLPPSIPVGTPMRK